MKAAVWARYGAPEALEVREIDAPVPGDSDILVEVGASSVTAGDTELRRSRAMGVLTIPLRLAIGITKPRGTRVPGQELAGEVARVGSGVTRFRVGDRVCAHSGFRFGGNAQYATVPERGMVVRISDQVGYEEATTLPTAGLYGLYFTRQADIRPGMSVLVNGGAGSIGTYTIQMALSAGARVDAVDRGDKAPFLAELGVSEVVDFRSEDFTERTNSYDVILDLIDKSSFRAASRALRPGGTYLHSNISPLAALRRMFFKATEGRHSSFVSGSNDVGDLEQLAAELAGGRLRSVIDRTFHLDEIVEAHRYAESGNKQGHVVISVR